MHSEKNESSDSEEDFGFNPCDLNLIQNQLDVAEDPTEIMVENPIDFNIENDEREETVNIEGGENSRESKNVTGGVRTRRKKKLALRSSSY